MSADTIVRAFALAHELHRGQTRKGTGIPYITHLMAVAALTGEHGGDAEQIAAALLHDAIEDGGGPEARARIEREFGPRIVALVEACTDTDETPKPPWRARKEAHIAAAAALEPAARLIIAADKLHNVRSMIDDYETLGEALWERFNGGRDGTLWYCRAMAEALAQDWEHAIADALNREVRRLLERAGGGEYA